MFKPLRRPCNSMKGNPNRTCRNPWNGECENVDIRVFIRHKREKKPICNSCWKDISKKGFEW
jgi:hypothetical protein